MCSKNSHLPKKLLIFWVPFPRTSCRRSSVHEPPALVTRWRGGRGAFFASLAFGGAQHHVQRVPLREGVQHRVGPCFLGLFRLVRTRRPSEPVQHLLLQGETVAPAGAEKPALQECRIPRVGRRGDRARRLDFILGDGEDHHVGGRLGRGGGRSGGL